MPHHDPDRCRPRVRSRWPRSRPWSGRLPAAPAAGLLAVALLTTSLLGGTPADAAVAHGATVSRGAHGATGTAHLLAFNDFHGNIDPPLGSGGLVNGVPAGGVEYLATTIKRLRAENRRTSDAVYTVAAGDLVGASPLVSAAFHDEPTIEAMNTIGLDVTAVGNHEFDEGVGELLRLRRGGCHPTDGCADGDGFRGARFEYLAANVVWRRNGRPILTPLEIRKVAGVPVAFVGMTLEGTPSIVNPAGIADVRFRDEVEVAREYATVLGRAGVHSIVLLLHEGGAQQVTAPAVTDPSACVDLTGAVTEIVRGLPREYGVVVSGHTHRAYTCSLPNAAGGTTLVTSAGSAGTLVTDISLSVDRRTRRIAAASARNVVVVNGVQNPDGSWARDPAGRYLRDPALVDPEVAKIADKYRTAVAPLANRVVGRITADITNTAVASGESALGDVIADAQLAYTASAGAQLALMNPGGIRTSLVASASAGGEAPGEVTYGEAFAVQPFNNLVVTQTFTGAQLKEVLEQQFAGYVGQTADRILQVSAGFGYRYDPTQPLGSRVSGLALGGVPVDPAATYRVTTNDFLANGGDGFTALTAGTDRATAPGFDVDALVAYLGAGPVAPGPLDRIVRAA